MVRGCTNKPCTPTNRNTRHPLTCRTHEGVALSGLCRSEDPTDLPACIWTVERRQPASDGAASKAAPPLNFKIYF